MIRQHLCYIHDGLESHVFLFRVVACIDQYTWGRNMINDVNDQIDAIPLLFWEYRLISE